MKCVLIVLAGLLAACAGSAPVEEEADIVPAGTVVKLDDALDAIVPADYVIEKIGEGFQFTEGPVWVPRDGGYLLFSDIDSNTVFRWDGQQSVPFLQPVLEDETPPHGIGGSNGLTLDAEGRLVLCEHGNRRVSRMELPGGERETLVDSYDGKRLNSPNDLVYRSDGSLYFTDPPYGLPDEDESDLKELDVNGVYRLAPDGELTLLVDDMTRPNGIALSPDEQTLYVANSDEAAKLWRAYDVQQDGSLANGHVLFDATAMEGEGLPDGMKVDTAGNLYATGPGGVLILTPDGRHLGTIQLAEVPANVGWGDSDGKTLYMTARTGLYRIRLNIAGLLPPGGR